MALKTFNDSLAEQRVRASEVMARIFVTAIVPDLADHATTALDISRALRYAGHALGEAHVEGDPMPADVLPDLQQAQADLAALISDIESAI